MVRQALPFQEGSLGLSEALRNVHISTARPTTGGDGGSSCCTEFVESSLSCVLHILRCRLRNARTPKFKTHIRLPYGQKTRRVRCPTHEPHYERRFMINQAR
jgi:hypothetical protein